MNNEVYFENVSNYGDLYLDKVFNEFEGENIIFTCKDKYNNYFLCVCYEIRYKLEWILCKIDISTLLKVICNQIDLHSVYKESPELINIIFDDNGDHISLVNYNDFNKNYLPTPGVFLKLDFDLTYYIYSLIIIFCRHKISSSERFIDWNITIEHFDDDVIYRNNYNNINDVNCGSVKIDYDFEAGINSSEEFSRISLYDAA